MKKLFYPCFAFTLLLFAGCMNLGKDVEKDSSNSLEFSNLPSSKYDQESNNKILLLEKTIEKQNKKISILNKERNELRSKLIELESKFKNKDLTVNDKDWKKYENKKYKFKLIFTSSWENFLVKQSDIKGDALDPDYIKLDFGFFIASENSFVEVFSINIHNKDMLTENDILALKQEDSFLEENDKYIYTFVLSEVDIDDLKEQLESLPIIRKSFELKYI